MKQDLQVHKTKCVHSTLSGGNEDSKGLVKSLSMFFKTSNYTDHNLRFPFKLSYEFWGKNPIPLMLSEHFRVKLCHICKVANVNGPEHFQPW